MAKILALKNFFKNPKPSDLSYKYRHFLNSLPSEKLKEILLFSEADHICSLFPDFKGKKVLFFNDQKHKFVFKKITAQEPDYLIQYVYEGQGLHLQNPGYCTLMGNLDRPCLKNLHFDCLISPFALNTDQIDEKIIKNLSQLIKNGGRLILALRHPQLEHVLYNQNPSETGSPENSLSHYFNLLKEHHLYCEEILEGCVDQSLKPFFSLEGDYDHYHEYKGTPITLLIRAVKFVKSSKNK